jgi:hypothetical protein
MISDLELLSSWSGEMQRHAYTALDAAEGAMGTLQGQASELVAAFRANRETLRVQAQLEIDARTVVGRRARKIYAPLNLFTRVRGGGLELSWQEVHRNRVTHRPAYKYLRLSADGNADLRLLLARALPFELELVRSTEERAKHIRGQWKRWLQLRNESVRALHLAEELVFRTASAPSGPDGQGGSQGGGLHDWIPAAP